MTCTTPYERLIYYSLKLVKAEKKHNDAPTDKTAKALKSAKDKWLYEIQKQCNNLF